MANQLQEHKKELRHWALEQRRTVTPAEPDWQSLLVLLETVREDAAILTYLPSALEMNPTGIRNRTDRRLAITRTPDKGRLLTLHLLDDSTELERHPFGYLQPVAGAPELAAEAIGMVLVPGLVFDLSGGRLGYGAGYYDRLLTRLRPGIPFVGVVHQNLIVDAVPMDERDVRMTHLITDAGVAECIDQQ